MKFSQEAKIEDLKLEKGGESKNQKMARICKPAMNSINPDLVFTVETQEDFEKERLPTLDFEIWQGEDGTLNHSYFQKQMKTPFVVMSRGAMPINQKIQILGNELTRRLSNVNKEGVGHKEILEIIEQFTQELKNSEYNNKQAREIITSGIRGWARKMARRQRDGQEFYRHSGTTLQARIKKKLIERETWYKNRQEDSEDEDTTPPLTKNKKHDKKTKPKMNQNLKKEPVRAVMFVPNTPYSKLAKELRKLEENLVGVTKNRFKIVERSGVKIQDLITRTNPWKGQDCQRDNCLICFTKQETEKNKNQCCFKRNLIYETRCLTCETRDKNKIIEESSTEQEAIDKIRNMKIHKYIGETSRSGYERG